MKLEYNWAQLELLEVKMKQRWQERIVIDPDIHHGDPCVKGTRIPVAIVVGSLADGLTFEDIRAAYPQLSDEDIYASLAYAAEVMRQEIVLPLPA
jgi:uncharacterized protein (DUF433 family)